MKKTRIIGIMAITVLALFIACVKDLENEGIYTETELIGTVVEKSSNAPLPNVKVKITDGDHIHASAITDADGSFSLNVNFSEINKSYYLLLDGSPNLPTKQEQLHGFGNKVYDCKLLVLYDKTDETLLPQVTTGEVSNIMTTTATVSGTVSSNGGHSLTERGICYATHQSPTVGDMCTTAGAELGTFSCNLTGLQTNVTYYVRAYAKNTIGIAYGTQKSFTPDGLPTVTTTAPTLNGNTLIAGGNVTSDGGCSVTARGICYGVNPNPDLSSAYTHTSNGIGTGYFTSSIPNASGTIYIRAYATNANGTNYGNQIVANIDYLALPTFQFNGHRYRVAPDPHTDNDQFISWTAADSYCQNLTAYGYQDWRMPTLEEMQQMYQLRELIGGWKDSYTTSGYYSYTYNPVYWSSGTSNGLHIAIFWPNGSTYSHTNLDRNGFIHDYPYLFAHVRPIRIEN